jgi:sugar diacid utilization regulator
MNLNLQILKEDLSDILSDSRIIDDRLDRRLAFVVIFNGEEQPLGDRLYLANASDLPSAISMEDRPSFLCIGPPPDQYFNGECNVLVAGKTVSIHTLLARVVELFHFYNSWELELQKVNTGVGGKAATKKLGMLSEPVFKNPLSLHDASMKYIFNILNKDRRMIVDDYATVEENAYLDLEDINILKHDKEFTMAVTKKEPSVYSGSLYEFRSLYFNIFLSDKYAARLLIDEANQQFSDRDFALIKVLGEAIQANLEMRAFLDQWHPKHLDEIFAKLLDRHIVNDEEIKNVLAETGWHMEEAYFCITVESSELDIANKTIFSTADRISSLAPNNCYRIHNDTIIYLFNTSAIKASRETIQEKLLPHLRDSFLKAGISAPFSGFGNLYYYYQQTVIALRLGKKKNPDYWYYRFDDYALDYIVENCTGVLTPESLCPEGLLRLYRHDRGKGTDYVSVLETYLENNMNATLTQQQLHIHRNTFYFKLNRLRAILDMNIEDGDTRLCLLMALKVMAASKIPGWG